MIKRNVNSVAGLQVFNLLRFITFFIISIVFTKIGITREQIGLFEVSLFIVSVASYFWVTGLVQAFLPLYRSSKAFGDHANDPRRKSPEIFNAWLVLMLFSVVVFAAGLVIQNNFSVFGYKGKVPLLNATLLYLFLSSPACLVEYIYMLRDKSGNTLSYAYITYSLTLVAVLVPLFLGYDIIWSLWGLVGIAAIRNIWLFTLLYNYAEFKINYTFIREHLKLAYPLIISTLISGSAQYIDGVVITTHFKAEGFALFRYGAKELPLVIMMAAGLSQAMLTEFNDPQKIPDTLTKIKEKSLRLMHWLFPISIVLLVFAKPMYWYVFSREFSRSADVFVVYILAILSRLVFPHTILMGLKKTRAIFWVSVFEFVLNIGFSVWLVQDYGVVGVALATVAVYLLSKVILVVYNYINLGISPSEYIPLRWYAFYSILLGIVFVLLDRRIINLWW